MSSNPGTPSRSSRKGGKRAASPAAANGQNNRRKKLVTVDNPVENVEASVTGVISGLLETGVAPAPQMPVETAPTEPPPAPTMVFKDPNFVHSSKGASSHKKTKVWKNLKQILASERALSWKPGEATYSTIEAPPSFKPARKYSDLSGLSAAYTDPQTKIRYFSPDEFSRVRMLPSDIVAGYLALRKANLPVP